MTRFIEGEWRTHSIVDEQIMVHLHKLFGHARPHHA